MLLLVGHVPLLLPPQLYGEVIPHEEEVPHGDVRVHPQTVRLCVVLGMAEVPPVC